MNTLRWVLLGLGFVAELLAWAGCGATALLFASGAAGWSMAAAIVGVIVMLWGVLMAPKATHPLPTPAYYAVKAVLYVWAIVVWVLLVPWLAAVFVALVALTEPLLFRHRQQEQASR